MKYIRFKVLSTGYIPNSIPPRFSDEYIRPIDLLGSDGVCHLDGRWNMGSMINYAYSVLCRHDKRKSIVGFDIIQAENYREDGRVLYTKRFNN